MRSFCKPPSARLKPAEETPVEGPRWSEPGLINAIGRASILGMARVFGPPSMMGFGRGGERFMNRTHRLDTPSLGAVSLHSSLTGLRFGAERSGARLRRLG